MDRRYIKKMNRYWAKEIEKAKASIEACEFTSWFDFWHTHPDWKGKGNKDCEAWAWVTNITYELLGYTEQLAFGEGDRLQVWATICEDSGNNAIYLHSDNPNNTPFPYDFAGVEWGLVLKPEGKLNIDYLQHEVGKKKYGDETVYFIRKIA